MLDVIRDNAEKNSPSDSERPTKRLTMSFFCDGGKQDAGSPDGVSAADDQQCRSNSIGSSFPTRAELGGNSKRRGKADFNPTSVKSSTKAERPRIQRRRSTISFGAPTPNSSPSEISMAQLPSSQNVKEPCSTYLSHVNYYEPRLQMNKIAAIRQGCLSGANVEMKEKKGKHASEQMQRPLSTLAYIMNASHTKVAADFYATMDLCLDEGRREERFGESKEMEDAVPCEPPRRKMQKRRSSIS